MKESASNYKTKHAKIPSTFKRQDTNSFQACISNLNSIHLSKKKKNLYNYYTNLLNAVNYHLEVSHSPSQQN